ncbi:MAG: methionine adenosyltransferase [Acidimicrobiia bacterium]|nr:methionine adenosyltransferase [Acidimicrobiia bacterium]
MRPWYFTSESVTEGHPDKVADRISDAVLDAVLAADPEGRVACEVLVTGGLVIIAGEISSTSMPDLESIARRVISDIGYTDGLLGFSADSCRVQLEVQQQSPDIADGVAQALEARRGSDDLYDRLGAGDQGIMFGFASNETEAFMPMPIQLAHRLAERLAAVRRDRTLDYLRPDGKTQVTVEYVEDQPVRVSRLLISTQHAPEVSLEAMESDLWKHVVDAVIPSELIDGGTDLLVNPSGRFELGGPAADTGLTGRKIVVDTYGGFSRHGGGAFSGKDPTKVDRSASYAARYAAKNLVAAGLADKVELQIAYAIGRAKPFSILVETFGTGRMPKHELEHLVAESFDFRPAAIIDHLDLRTPIYEPTAAYGHFGRPQFSWERTDQVTALRTASG